MPRVAVVRIIIQKAGLDGDASPARMMMMRQDHGKKQSRHRKRQRTEAPDAESLAI